MAIKREIKLNEDRVSHLQQGIEQLRRENYFTSEEALLIALQEDKALTKTIAEIIIKEIIFDGIDIVINLK